MSYCNVPFPAPATQSHAPTLPGCFNRLRLPPNVTLVLRLPNNVTIQRTIPCTSQTDPRCNWKCHVYKRANFTCTSEPISRVQANPRPFLRAHGVKVIKSLPKHRTMDSVSQTRLKNKIFTSSLHDLPTKIDLPIKHHKTIILSYPFHVRQQC